MVVGAKSVGYNNFCHVPGTFLGPSYEMINICWSVGRLTQNS